MDLWRIVDSTTYIEVKYLHSTAGFAFLLQQQQATQIIIMSNTRPAPPAITSITHDPRALSSSFPKVTVVSVVNSRNR